MGGVHDAGTGVVRLSDLGAEMKLSKEDYGKLLSAGFTERQITTMQEKFYTLLQTVPLPEPAHLRNLAAAIAACKVKDEVIEFLSDGLAPESMGYKDAKKALAIQPDDTALKAWLGEAIGEWKKADGANYIKIFWHSDYLAKEGDKFYSPKGLK